MTKIFLISHSCNALLKNCVAVSTAILQHEQPQAVQGRSLPIGCTTGLLTWLYCMRDLQCPQPCTSSTLSRCRMPAWVSPCSIVSISGWPATGSRHVSLAARHICRPVSVSGVGTIRHGCPALLPTHLTLQSESCLIAGQSFSGFLFTF